MSRAELIERKQTDWLGLWWHAERNAFSSQAINLAVLKKFKGNVRLYVTKNQYYNKGENGRPNYVFCIKDAHSESFAELNVIDDKNRKPYKVDETYYTEDGDRLYTREEVQYAIDCAARDCARGYGPGDNIVTDYI